MKYLIYIFAFLLPLHALIITFLKCRLEIDESIMNVLRFWKEGFIILFLVYILFYLFKKYSFNINKILKNNYLVGTSIAFIIVAGIYIFFPYFSPKLSAYLGFKYDVFFILALIIGFYLHSVRENFETILKTLFTSIGIILVVFLPVYLLGEVAILSEIFGYSNKVSTYEANGCISYAQNVNGHPRFQGTFGGPIRFSVFLAVFFFVYLGFIIDKIISIVDRKKKILSTICLVLIPFLIVSSSLFFSFSKTSILGFMFGIGAFAYLTLMRKGFKIPKKIVYSGAGAIIASILALVLVKGQMFLHLGSLEDRTQNLFKSLEMFAYNPLGYGLGVAGPASIVNQRFWPENWYIQILLEMGPLGLVLFISLMLVIFTYLFRIYKSDKSFLSIGILVGFLCLLFMANFTHAFEESATSYILFLLIGAYISQKLNLKTAK